MSQERRKSTAFENAMKGFHRRMSSSFGRPPRTSNSPYEHFPPILDDSNASSVALTSRSSSMTSTSNRRNDERDTRLISLDKLMDGVAVKDKDRQCFEKINIAVRRLMNSAEYDPSHDYEHIQRVVMNAHHIWHAEKEKEEFCNVNPLVIYIAAMVHDVADENHVSSAPDEDLTDIERQERQRDAVEAFMKEASPHCPPHIWGPVSHIASLVSFSRELRNLEFIKQQCAAYPALQIVQDADRLDGLGAVGIVRGAVYGGARELRGTGTVRRVVQVVNDRHSEYVGLMKTRTGKKEAAKRWDTMMQIRDQIMDQVNCNGVLEAY